MSQKFKNLQAIDFIVDKRNSSIELIFKLNVAVRNGKQEFYSITSWVFCSQNFLEKLEKNEQKQV